MVTDAQVRVLRRKIMSGKTQEAAAAAAGMSIRAARKWARGAMPSEARRPRTWRTREDPFADIWERDVVPLLAGDRDGVLQATTVIDVLEERYAGRFGAQHLRTLQRRMREWRALHGPAREVFFEQVHPPGREAACDFTHGTSLGVTIAGKPFVHLLFELILSFSKWRWVGLAYGETFEALVAGVQGALWELGGVPEVLRSDNLSAATHDLKEGGRALTQRFKAVLDHYGMRSTRIEPGEAHQNGVVEKGHHITKTAIEQALVVRGARDFAGVAEYECFVRNVVARACNHHVADKLEEERVHLRPLPSARLPGYTPFEPVVRRWSTIRIGGRTYSVPSRLIGHTVQVRRHPDVVEVFFRGQLTETMPRLRGEIEHRIDYRHVIWSLVRKPGAFARYKYREELFPSLVFRRAYDALREWRGERADVEYVRILHLAASTMQSLVEAALVTLLERGTVFDYVEVQRLAAPRPSEVPDVHIAAPDLRAYDALLIGGAR
jgi:hypothetical protein